MKLKSKKKILAFTLMLSFVIALSSSLSALALGFYWIGVTQSPGVVSSAYAWTYSDTSGAWVNARFVKTSNWETMSSANGYGSVYSPQKTFVRTSIMGMHSTQNNGETKTARTWP